ncbi:BtpA/SgcQ family protein [Leifsonia sp. YAF41]|uniref:BtpA/SgcQ family protein n=1 Tax=Leifsonia sp. YAF41 TaxID=3233086 RepID=UPI003F976D56
MTSKRAAFLDLLATGKPVLGMVHLTGADRAEKLSIAQREIDVLYANGVDAVIIENYFGTPDDVENVLGWLAATHPTATYGVNVLDDDERGFALAGEFGASFVQLDSVAGHLTPEDEPAFAERLAEMRTATDAALLGGVRFKYQPYLSGNSLETDLRLGMERADAIVVTGSGTGIETSLDSITEFRGILGDFPLVVGAGITAANCAEQFALVNAAIIGSAFKDTRKDSGAVLGAHVVEITSLVKGLR